VVVDLKDPLAPELSLQDFRDTFAKDPDKERYRIINIELITSPDDLQPMLVSESARYSRFLKRESDSIYFRKELDSS
jgi:hypothetical protein